MSTKCANHKLLSLMASVALAAGLLASPFPALSQAAEKPGDPLQWGPCPKDVVGKDNKWNLQCATFTVPMDYQKPHGKKISIMMSRVKSTGQSRGVIMNNPGGPGGSGLGLWAWMLSTGSQPLLKHFDLIAVQPRGLMHATPLEPCIKPQILDPVQQEKPEPKTTKEKIQRVQEDVKESVADVEKIIDTVNSDPGKKVQEQYEKCKKTYDEYFPYVHTENTARDFDMARQYLGQPKINFYGASYGTWLGAVYATLFPEHTGRFVLDSAVDPTQIWTTNFGNQGDMQRRRMYEMFDFIAAHNNIYHLGDTPLKVYTRWYRIIEKELSGPGTPRLSAPPAQVGDVPPEFKRHIQLYLGGYNLARPIRDRIERAVRAWEAPTPKMEHNLWDLTGAAFTSRSAWPKVAAYMQHPQPKPMTKEEKEETVISANVFTAVTCNENSVLPDPLNLAALGAAYFTGADFFTLKNLLTTSGLMCPGTLPSTIPVKVTGSQLSIRPVVLQSYYDTQTPYAGGVKMADAMNAYLVKVEGGDHGVYVRHSPKAWKLVNDYFLKSPVVTEQHLPYATVEKLVVKLDEKK